jgi:DDE superfamily endonuclease
MRPTGARCDLLGDETGLPSDDVRGRSYTPRGQTSTVLSSHRRVRLGLISAVSNKGELRWMVLDGALEAAGLIRFLQRLPWPGWPAACRQN